MTGFSPKTRRIIHDRANGQCERCTSWDATDVHHRRPRGAGGSKDPITNSPANGVLACRPCHLEIESQRTRAFMDGWLLRQSQDPRNVPVRLYQNRWAFLTAEGGINYVD